MLPIVASFETTALNPAAHRGAGAARGVPVLIGTIELDAELVVTPRGTLFADESAMVPVRLVRPGRVTNIWKIVWLRRWRRLWWLGWRCRGSFVLMLLVGLLSGLLLPICLVPLLILSGSRRRAAQAESGDQRSGRTQESTAGRFREKRAMKIVEPVVFGHDRPFQGCESISAATPVGGNVGSRISARLVRR